MSKQPVNTTLIIFTVMLVAILEVLDSTIVNVALPAMMPSLSATQDEITWVLTSYVVAAAVMLPLTGFLAKRLGQKHLLYTSVVGFMISSVLCGMASSLSMMVTFRLLQGAFGASLIPLSQSILRQTFPVEKQGKAMAIWALGIMVAPALGPTLGGFITENSNWRWIFYINFPVCLLGLVMTFFFIPKDKSEKSPIDHIGILAMFIGVGSLQLFLDQGNSKNWFDSHLIIILLVSTLLGIAFFLLRCASHPHPVIKLPIFKDKNFSIASICMAVFAAGLFGFIALEPLMLESLYGYTAYTAGLTISPVGLASSIVMPITATLMPRIDIRVLLSVSLSIVVIALYLATGLTLQADRSYMVLINMLIGVGMGLFMVPLTTQSLLTLDPKDYTEGAGLYTYGRMLGTSSGISLLSTLVSRETQINWQRIGEHINQFDPNLTRWIQHTHLTLNNPQTYGILANTLQAQASMGAFIDAYFAIMLGLAALIPVVWCLKPVDLKSVGHIPMH
jgi:DHA2 family multidrug resistance protein